MWRRQWVGVIFIVKGFKFRGRTLAVVNIDEDGELIDDYLMYPENLEDVEFVEPICKKFNEADIPNEDDLTEDDLYDIIGISI